MNKFFIPKKKNNFVHNDVIYSTVVKYSYYVKMIFFLIKPENFFQGFLHFYAPQ